LSAVWTFVEKLAEIFPALLQTLRECPDQTCDSPNDQHSVWYLVAHLNDDHRWSREEIASWLEGLDTDLTFPVPSNP